MSEVRDFPAAEYEARLSKLQAAMAEDGLDAVLVADDKNVRYLTGHYTDFWHNEARHPLAWIPRSGEPILIVNGVEEAWARETIWFSEVRTYEELELTSQALPGIRDLGFETEIARVAAEDGRELGISSRSRVGAPRGSHMRLDMGLGVLLDIQSELGFVAWHDVSGVLWDMRVVKSDAEVAYLTQAVDILDAAYAATIPEVSRDITESDLARGLRARILTEGADAFAFTSVADIREGNVSSPAPRKYDEQAIVHLDGGAVVRGYAADHCRLVWMSEPSDKARAAYEVAVDAMAAGFEAARPGNTAADVANAMYKTLEDAGADPTTVSRVGHGTGLEQPEPPSLHPRDETPLEPGVVLSVEPNALFEDVGLLIVEDMLVVTEDGPRGLSSSPTPRELLVAG